MQQYSQDDDMEHDEMDQDVMEDDDDEMYGTGGPIPQAVIKEALRKMNLREGLFSEEDINHLENGGYSVSETDGDDEDDSNQKINADAELMSLRSGLSGVGGPLVNGLMISPEMQGGLAKDPNLAPFFPERF
jgi:hypothetical protein